eukprot:7387538-Prymnesium_polylepis.2
MVRTKRTKRCYPFRADHIVGPVDISNERHDERAEQPTRDLVEHHCAHHLGPALLLKRREDAHDDGVGALDAELHDRRECRQAHGSTHPRRQATAFV